MRVTLFLSLLILMQACDCEETCLENAEAAIPGCIQDMIKEFENAPVRNPPASITMIVTPCKRYFYIPAECCDQFNPLLDENCRVVCYPDGGIAGQGSGTCPDLENATRILIWEDKRNTN